MVFSMGTWALLLSVLVLSILAALLAESEHAGKVTASARHNVIVKIIANIERITVIPE